MSRCGLAAVVGGGVRCFVGINLSSSSWEGYSQDSGEGYSQDACRWTYRNTTRKRRGEGQTPRAGQATPTQQKKLGTGGREFDVDEDRQTTTTVPRTIPEGGPIPLHRDTTASIHWRERTRVALALSLYKILFHFKAIADVNHPFIAPPQSANSTLLRYYCTTIAQYTPAH